MKLFITLLVSLIPINSLKIFLYRSIFSYNISYDSKIGFFNVIKAKSFISEKATIGNFNLINGDNVVLKKGAIINKFNRIKNFNNCQLSEDALIFSWNFISGIPKNKFIINHDFNNQNITLGKTSELLRRNYVDLVDEVMIGDNVVFGGNGSEIWTHGFNTKREMLVGKVIFGNNIFIGSNCVFTKGVSIIDETTIAPGSVIYKNIIEKGIYSTHEIRKIK